MKKLFVFMAFLCCVFVLFAENETNKKVSMGVGIGIPYGVFGFNADYNVNNYFAATAGFGTALAGVGYCIGGRGYFRGINKKWRPRVTAVYGTNGIVMGDVYGADKAWHDNSIDHINETYSGLSAGIGQLIQWGDKKQYGVDFDIIMILSSGVYDRVDELNDDSRNDVSNPGRVKISLGYRYQF